jgi:hypothetical protein
MRRFPRHVHYADLAALAPAGGAVDVFAALASVPGTTVLFTPAAPACDAGDDEGEILDGEIVWDGAPVSR